MKTLNTVNTIQTTTFEQPLIKNPTKDFEKAVNAFLSNQVGKFGKYFALPNALVYRTIITENHGSKQVVGQDVIARKLGVNLFVGNASILPLINRRVSFGRESLNNGITAVQEALSDLIPMLPFNVFEEAGLSLSELKILERGPEETISRRYDNPKYNRYQKSKMKEKNIPEFLIEAVHFTGASLYEIQGSYFLFDIDREEIKHNIFNPFLVEVSTPVNTIAEAYHVLKPMEVLEAEKNGLEVIRQGEWFFIPSDITLEKIFESEVDEDGNLKNWGRVYRLKAGPNRPNLAQFGGEIDGNHYVKGLVQHTGREHRDITLKGWYRAVPNTATKSFTIEGDID